MLKFWTRLKQKNKIKPAIISSIDHILKQDALHLYYTLIRGGYTYSLDCNWPYVKTCGP